MTFLMPPSLPNTFVTHCKKVTMKKPHGIIRNWTFIRFKHSMPKWSERDVFATSVSLIATFWKNAWLKNCWLKHLSYERKWKTFPINIFNSVTWGSVVMAAFPPPQVRHHDVLMLMKNPLFFWINDVSVLFFTVARFHFGSYHSGNLFRLFK